jgi:hypothetical protein
MFEGPSDLIVVPCSTVPTVSYFVADRLGAFNLPIPTKSMAPGEVVFHRLESAGQVAPVAAYAASVVPRTREDAGTIEAIGRALGSFAAENPWVQQISCPLLGTGAGGLKEETSVEELLRGFSATGRDDVLLRVFVLQDLVFEGLKTHFDIPARNEWDHGERSTRPTRVFVSYTRTNDAHAAWVKELAKFLRANGIEARLDVWYLRPGMDTPQWMSNELDLADRVLLVCDELYAQKADRRHGGVGWEIRIIQGDLLASQEDNPDKYIPIIVTPELEAGTPKFLRGTFALHWPESDPGEAGRRDELLRIIYHRQEEAPPLGRPPSFILASLKLADLVPGWRPVVSAY